MGYVSTAANIYDATGNQIRMIELGHIPAGNYVESSKAIYWDGRTKDGEQVSSGTYFYQIEAGDYTATRKMVIKSPLPILDFSQHPYIVVIYKTGVKTSIHLIKSY